MGALLSSPDTKMVWSGYRLRRLRGYGAFGRVYEAEAPDGAAVAIKLVPIKSRAAVPEIRNVQLVSQLRHPNIVRVDKVWCERERLLIAMELGDGSLQDLAEVSQIEFGAPLPAQLLVDYFCQAATGIDFLNAREHLIGEQRAGIQHRDIKPSNLMLVGNQVKLCDFGLATAISGHLVGKSSAGTSAFAAPEVFHGELSGWTDQYALAVSYCHLRGGRLPFRDTPNEFRRDYKRPVPDLSMLDISERPIIARALATAPQSRWSSCGEMVHQLQALTPCARPAHSERRLESRRPCPHQPPIEILITGERLRHHASIVDLSTTGMGLLLSRPISAGSSFLFSVKIGPATEPQLRVASVVRGARQKDGRWFIGCRLALPLLAEEMDALFGVENAAVGSGSGSGISRSSH
jgi:serine/threonine protein kinase